MIRGQNEFKEMWFTDDVDYDIDGASAFIGDEDTTGGIIKALEDARDGDTAILLDTTSNGDAPLMAGAFIKNEGAGDPANTGNERAKITLEAKVDGLQKSTDMTTYKAILAMKGLRKNVYHIDRRLGVVEKAKNMPVKIAGDGTNNQANVTTISSEQIGTESDIWMRRTIPITKLTQPILLLPENEYEYTGIAEDVEFSWDPVQSATSYDLALSVNGGAETIYNSLTNTLLIEDLPSGSYHWRVRAKNGQYYGSYSEPFIFSILF